MVSRLEAASLVFVASAASFAIFGANKIVSRMSPCSVGGGPDGVASGDETAGSRNASGLFTLMWHHLCSFCSLWINVDVEAPLKFDSRYVLV